MYLVLCVSLPYSGNVKCTLYFVSVCHTVETLPGSAAPVQVEPRHLRQRSRRPDLLSGSGQFCLYYVAPGLLEMECFQVKRDTRRIHITQALLIEMEQKRISTAVFVLFFFFLGGGSIYGLIC